jgi:hypothetical protein
MTRHERITFGLALGAIVTVDAVAAILLSESFLSGLGAFFFDGFLATGALACVWLAVARRRELGRYEVRHPNL